MIPNGVFIKNTQLYMFCVNKSLKTVVSTVSGLGGERSWVWASHPFGEVMRGTTTLKT